MNQAFHENSIDLAQTGKVLSYVFCGLYGFLVGFMAAFAAFAIISISHHCEPPVAAHDPTEYAAPHSPVEAATGQTSGTGEGR